VSSGAKGIAHDDGCAGAGEVGANGGPLARGCELRARNR
jgi:hypothetical protein